MTEDAAGEASFERLWQEFLDSDMNRFKAMHQRARAEAGPSFIGGARGIDHWTFDWARRAVLFCLQEGSAVILSYAESMGEAPSDLVRRARPGLRAQQERYFAILEEDMHGPPANEFSVRPSREALAEVRRFVHERTERALSALSRGRIDEDLAIKPAWYSAIAARVGGGQRLFLYCVVAVFLLAMWLAV